MEVRARLALVASVVALTLAILPAALAQGTAPSGTTPPFTVGLADGRLLSATDAELNADLDQDASLGVGALREQLSWAAAEPRPGDYEWTDFDRLVAAASAHHLRLLALVDFTPAWARPIDCASMGCPPAHPAQFAAFAALAARRYGSAVEAWEIWNEPNTIGMWEPGPNAASYSRLLEMTAAAIHRAVPGAFVVSGGLAPTSPPKGITATAFLTGMCEAGALKAVDAVGDHPYSYPVPPDYRASWNPWQQMADTPVSFRTIMAGCGAAGLPLWLTEYGAPTGGPGPAASSDHYDLAEHPNHVTDVLQAQMLVEAIRDASSEPWIGSLFIYSAVDTGFSPLTNEDHFGLRTARGTPKPSWRAVSATLR